MGYFFIDNEHDYDIEKCYYCKCCKELYNRNVEISTSSKCTQLQCETIEDICYVLIGVNQGNVNIDKTDYRKMDIHPDTDSKFMLLDLDPVTHYGIVYPIECRLCWDALGWVIWRHILYDHFSGLSIIKKDKLL